MDGCIGCSKVNPDDFIFDSKYWNIILSDDQQYLGRCIVSCKRHVPSLSEITAEEFHDFYDVAKTLESTLSKAFGAKMYNWGCLMNDAYKNMPPNPHVHWHLRPRYDHDVSFAGIIFSDKEFGHHYHRDTRLNVDQTIRKKIISEINKNLE
jgi:diadenosine tetraphosphate (Ap4A) HIT family hydrolase